MHIQFLVIELQQPPVGFYFVHAIEILDCGMECIGILNPAHRHRELIRVLQLLLGWLLRLHLWYLLL